MAGLVLAVILFYLLALIVGSIAMNVVNGYVGSFLYRFAIHRYSRLVCHAMSCANGPFPCSGGGAEGGMEDLKKFSATNRVNS